MLFHYCLVGVVILGILEKTFALPPCAACITTTRTGQKITQTLLYHSYYTCTGTVSRCIYNGTELNICTKGKSKTCYNPRQNPSYYTFEIRWNDEDGAILNITKHLTSPTKPITLNFDAYDAINRNAYHRCGSWERAYYYDDKYMCPEGAYGWGKCTGKSTAATIYTTSSKHDYFCPKWECVYFATWKNAPTGRDGDHRKGSLTKIGLSEPKKCQKGACNPLQLFIANPSHWKQGYKFGLRIAGGGVDPGTVLYLRLNTNTHVSSPYRIHHSFYEAMKSEFEIPPASQNLFFELAGAVASSLHVTDCLFCGGACVLGTIRPSFFLLPTSQGEQLGYPVYRSQQLKEALKIGQWNKWNGEEWPPERIISYYGPATWEQDGTWGYRTPVYMINRIIRLQAVVEIITNETSKALTLLAKQSTQMQTAIYQNRLALDYLIAAEGGVCGKLNLSNCCLQINNNGHVVEDLAIQMREQTFVPVQTWHSLKMDGWFGSLFSWMGGLKSLMLIVLFILAMCLLLPCLLPLCLRMITSSLDNTIERKAATKVLALWRYHPIPHNADAVTPV